MIACIYADLQDRSAHEQCIRNRRHTAIKERGDQIQDLGRWSACSHGQHENTSHSNKQKYKPLKILLSRGAKQRMRYCCGPWCQPSTVLCAQAAIAIVTTQPYGTGGHVASMGSERVTRMAGVQEQVEQHGRSSKTQHLVTQQVRTALQPHALGFRPGLPCITLTPEPPKHVARDKRLQPHQAHSHEHAGQICATCTHACASTWTSSHVPIGAQLPQNDHSSRLARQPPCPCGETDRIW